MLKAGRVELQQMVLDVTLPLGDKQHQQHQHRATGLDGRSDAEIVNTEQHEASANSQEGQLSNIPAAGGEAALSSMHAQHNAGHQHSKPDESCDKAEPAAFLGDMGDLARQLRASSPVHIQSDQRCSRCCSKSHESCHLDDTMVAGPCQQCTQELPKAPDRQESPSQTSMEAASPSECWQVSCILWCNSLVQCLGQISSS